ELTQGAHFVASDGMGGRFAVLGPAYMQGRPGKIDLRPFQFAKLGRSQSMAKRHEEHRCVPMSVPISLCGLDQPFDLVWGEVFALAIFAIWQPCRCDCSVFDDRID